jgi:hypothetical protein
MMMLRDVSTLDEALDGMRASSLDVKSLVADSCNIDITIVDNLKPSFPQIPSVKVVHEVTCPSYVIDAFLDGWMNDFLRKRDSLSNNVLLPIALQQSEDPAQMKWTLVSSP